MIDFVKDILSIENANVENSITLIESKILFFTPNVVSFVEFVF